jgi:hypothetical protein
MVSRAKRSKDDTDPMLDSAPQVRIFYSCLKQEIVCILRRGYDTPLDGDASQYRLKSPHYFVPLSGQMCSNSVYHVLLMG